MILADRRKKERLPRIAIAGILALILAFSAPFLYHKVQSRWLHKHGVPPGQIYCDAEYREGLFFRNGDFQFDNGNTQSSARAHSGKYACRLLPGDNYQFGIGVRLPDLQPGGLYRATVWRYQSAENRSFLAARSEGGKNPFYRTQGYSTQKDSTGWEQLELHFFIPYGQAPDFAEVYVFSHGKDTVYFDDFRVELVHTFPESDFQLPVFDLQIGKNALQKLEKKRAEALHNGLLEAAPDDWVKARLRWTGLPAPISARVRLKGDWLDHLNTEKWSFRVDLGGDQFWRGMQTFSLQHPGTRYFLHEWLLHECWKQEGVLTTNYDFAELRLNGSSLGLYAIEEHFEKYLVERQGRREGPILKLDESGFWEGLQHQIAQTGAVAPGMQLPTARASNATIEPFEARRTGENPDLTAMSRHAASLLDQFRSGQRPASALFDLDQMARFYAVADVFGGQHSTQWHNLRFYYNPLKDRLEPIGFDAFGTGPSERGSFLLQGYTGPREGQFPELQDLLFLDTSFVAAYLGYLDRYSAPGYLEHFFQSVDSTRLPREMALLGEFPQYVFQDQEFIRSVRRKRVMLYPQAGYAFEARLPDGQHWELRNLHPYPLRVLGYANGKKGAWTHLAESQWITAAPDRPLWEESSRDSSGVWMAMDHFRSTAGQLLAGKGWVGPQPTRLPANAGWVVYQLPGIDTLFRQELRPGLSPPSRTPRQELFDPPFRERDPRWVVQNRVIRFRPGPHTITEMIAIPEGYLVEAGPGVVLDFVGGGGFLSRSPIRFTGSPEEPVRITSSDHTGNGFTVLAPAAPSLLENVVFEQIQALNRSGWTQTGAVSFADATVTIKNCIFRYTRSEDALNLVQSRVDLHDCLFLDVPSDGLDCDFCQGTIAGTTFRLCRNDGLDVSGSRLEVSACTLESCGEKGISVGERSDIVLLDSRISNTPTALAVKDLSIALVDELSLSACGTGFAVFQKKPEYGPGRLVVRNYQADTVDRLWSVQKGSRLQVGSKVVGK
ncbi:MAG: CotH kinase family protein [Lewinellaceae bacterium]|nr:CotH kinase family protein [Lewinellaceae bacterium]